MSATVRFELEVIPDDSPDVSYLEQECFDDEEGRARLAAYHAGDWHMVGVCAVAHITVKHYKYSTSYTLKSAGLWGIESDSSDEYIKEMFAEECATLTSDLTEFGKLEIEQ